MRQNSFESIKTDLLNLTDYVKSFSKNNWLNCRNNRLNWLDSKVNQLKLCQTCFKNTKCQTTD